jgi:hypothetical protein
LPPNVPGEGEASVRAAALFTALLLAGSLAGGITICRAGGAPELLPDLEQDRPSDVAIRTVDRGGSRRHLLVFASAVANVGAGPLVIEGRRTSTAQPRMTADQLVFHADGSTQTIRRVGRLRYVVSPDHEHWHLLDFDRYELRRASDFTRVVRDRKTGFCLGDRYAVGPESGEPTFTGACGLGRRDLPRIAEGISPGFGDDYRAALEGQYLDVTRVRAGRYLLVHRANPRRTLMESDYTNNASSMLLDLAWPRGRSAPPEITQIAVCPGAERCDG